MQLVPQESVLVDADANLEKNPQRGPLAEIALPRLGQLVCDRCAAGFDERPLIASCPRDQSAAGTALYAVGTAQHQ